jgi:hypothetical protein
VADQLAGRTLELVVEDIEAPADDHVEAPAPSAEEDVEDAQDLEALAGLRRPTRWQWM